MSKRLIFFILSASAVVGTLFFLFYPIAQFSTPSRRYGVGITTYHWVDQSRQELNAQNLQHPNRELMVYCFYPTHKHVHQEPYNQDQVVGYKGVLSYTSKLPAWIFSGLDFLKVNEQPNAPLVECKEKFPVVIVSHGWGALVHGWTWFCELLASHGYFVVGINHPYVAQVTRYPDNRVVETLVFKKAAERKKEGGEELYRSWKEGQVEICAQDVSSVIDKLEELSKQGAEFWSNKIDLDRIGVMGGSFGGTVSMRACRKDPRIKCCVDMDGCLRGEDVMAEYSKPSLIILGGASNQWVGKQGEQDLEVINFLCNRYQGIVNKVVIEKAGHGVFSDIPFYGQTTLFLRVFAHYSNFYQTASSKDRVSMNLIRSMLVTLKSQIVGFFDKTLVENSESGQVSILKG